MENTQLPASDDDAFASAHRSTFSRTHMPPTDSVPSRPRPHKAHSGLTPPVRRGSPLNPQNASISVDSRRRPWGNDTLPSTDLSLRQRRPTAHIGNVGRVSDSPPEAVVDDGRGAEPDVGVFSNEYDLAHEDPRILQDVQRALKLKARREARMKRDAPGVPIRSSVQHDNRTSSSNNSPNLPFPAASSSASSTPIAPPATSGSHRKSSNSTASEVDFSPSTGLFDAPLKSHPVPCSIDNGATLDWTGGSVSDGERHWTKSITGKKKERDKLPPLGVVVGEQEKSHKEKLARISNLVSAQTNRKAHITSDQLGRRYRLLYDSLSNPTSSFNLLNTTRWYSHQPEVVRKSLERTEPFTWLKHLDKRSSKPTRLSWHLSALVMEEYASTEDHVLMQTIPEDSPLPTAKTTPRTRRSRSPSFLSPARSPTMDDRISFEPLSDSKRNSLDANSRKSVDSALSSVRTGSSSLAPVPAPPLSPSSSKFNDTTKDQKSAPEGKRAPSPSPSSVSSSAEVVSTQMKPEASMNLAIPAVALHPPSEKPPYISVTASGSSQSTQAKILVSPINQSTTSLRASLKPRKRVSLPNAAHTRRQQKMQKKEREEHLRREYDAKTRILQEAMNYNGKIRQLLNRISVGMKGYDSIQSLTAESLKLNLPLFPKEVIEAFGHDPAGVTGPTRRLGSWRAVEDIHHRIHKQQQTFVDFLQFYEDEVPMPGCALDDSIIQLLEMLDALSMQKVEIGDRAETVSTILHEVKDLHATVKEQYNVTVAHASVAYPELSHIIALDESYKDQYQQLTDLGMDALTLLLDTVTPVWRTYGKTIGEDVRDFLIIPLYRNEFTGEAKRYSIKEFPRRSLRHWIGLFLFFLFSIGINILQVRAAISSTSHYRLQLIPYDGVRWTALPLFWIGIIIQWLAVVLEFAVVFMQLGVITWWVGWSVTFVC